MTTYAMMHATVPARRRKYRERKREINSCQRAIVQKDSQKSRFARRERRERERRDKNADTHKMRYHTPNEKKAPNALPLLGCLANMSMNFEECLTFDSVSVRSKICLFG